MSNDNVPHDPDHMPDVGAQVQRGVRPPRKATLDRLFRVLDDWRREEQNLCSHYGPPSNLPGSYRRKRIKDAEALQQTLAYLLASRSSGKAA
ncbi:MAG: hypothetical protein KAY54_04465 [Burkholderiaceae bacterium]|nr:hypothetical protein [Burkholderiaceae bacterium]